MADRDTTSTPYRLSADAVCYFRYPEGDAPVVTVADYAELRTKGSSDVGYRDRIAVTDLHLKGPFEYSATDPYGQGDDGGIVIAAADGWWVRLHTPQKNSPVLMDWFQVTEDQDITALLLHLASIYPVYLHLRLPSVSRVILDNLSTGGHVVFTLQGGATVMQKNPPSGSLWQVWTISNTPEIEFSRVNFLGRYGEFGTIEEYPGTLISGSFVEINLPSKSTNVIIDADFTDTTSRGLSISGAGADYVEITGTYANSGFGHFATGVSDHLHVDVTITDPAGNALKLWSTGGGLFEKWHGAWLQWVNKVTGIVRLQYGGAEWFMAAIGDMGNSVDDPLIFDATHIGYSPAGQAIGDVGVRQWHVGKFDGLLHPWPQNRRFLKHTDDRMIRSKRHTQYECSEENQGQFWHANDVYTISDMDPSGPLFDAGSFNANQNEMKGHTLTGVYSHLTVTIWESSVINATCGSMGIGESSIYYAHSNTYNNVTITNSINVKTGQHTFNSLTFTGEARDIITINSTFIDGVNDAVVLDIYGLSAPAGSVIRHVSGAAPVVNIEGSPVTLPYTVPS